MRGQDPPQALAARVAELSARSPPRGGPAAMAWTLKDAKTLPRPASAAVQGADPRDGDPLEPIDWDAKAAAAAAQAAASAAQADKAKAKSADAPARPANGAANGAPRPRGDPRLRQDPRTLSGSAAALVAEHAEAAAAHAAHAAAAKPLAKPKTPSPNGRDQGPTLEGESGPLPGAQAIGHLILVQGRRAAAG